MRCEAVTDKGGFSQLTSLPGAVVDFSAIDFQNLIFETRDTAAIPISEKEKGWIEKEITVVSDEYCTPIGIDSITYRYTLRGRIKMN